MPAFVLMGSGEFMPWAREPDQWAVANASNSSDRVLVVPAASAPEGADVYMTWAKKGLDYFAGFGLKPELLDIRSRDDAEQADRVRQIEGSRYIFFSGGNPSVLAELLAGTAAWKAIREAAASGTALGGCSAGMVALGVAAPDASGAGPNREGLKLFSNAYFGAHWDRLDEWVPGLTQRILDAWPRDSVFFACDEETAACGDGTSWKVMGCGGLTIPSEDGLEHVLAGGEVSADLGFDGG